MDLSNSNALILKDHAGAVRAGIGLKPGGVPTISLMRKAGNVIWSTP